MTLEPNMARATDGAESQIHNAALPKTERSRLILRRLFFKAPQSYVTLCDFGQKGGPAANRTLLTNLEREGLVQKVGRIGAAGAFSLTEKGARLL